MTDPIEARKVLATQEDSPCASLDLTHVPEPLNRGSLTAPTRWALTQEQRWGRR